MEAAPAAIPPNPKMAAAMAMIKNTRAQVSMGPPSFLCEVYRQKCRGLKIMNRAFSRVLRFV
jgi:hypothetical protein